MTNFFRNKTAFLKNKLQAFFVFLKNYNFHWKNKLLVVVPIFIVALTIDIVTKQLALHYLTREKLDMFAPGFLGFQLTVNPGIAFGFQLGSTWVIVIPILIFLFALGVLIFASSKIIYSSLAFVVAGALGNLLDRFWNNGNVVDFIYWGLTSPHTIFNMADFFIIFGIILMGVGIVLAYLIDFIKQRRSTASEEDENDGNETSPKASQRVVVIEKDQKALSPQITHESKSPHKPPKNKKN